MDRGMASSGDLPPEIWLRVVEEIKNPRTLACLCRASKSLRDYALPCLYHDLYIEPMSRKVHRLAQAMFSSGNLGLSYIRTLRISGYIDVPGQDTPTLLRDVFELATLNIPADTIVALKWEDVRPSIRLDQLVKFLRSQKRLRHLQLPRILVTNSGYSCLMRALGDNPGLVPKLWSLVSEGWHDNGRDPLGRESAIVAAADDSHFLQRAMHFSRDLQAVEIKFHGPSNPAADRRFRTLFRKPYGKWEDEDVDNMKRMNLVALNISGRSAALPLLEALASPPWLRLKSLCLNIAIREHDVQSVEDLLWSFTGLERLIMILDSGPETPSVYSILNHHQTLKTLVVYAGPSSFINGMYDYNALRKICQYCKKLHTLGLSFFVFGPNPSYNSNHALPVSNTFFSKWALLQTLPELETLAIVNQDGDYGWTSWTRSERTRNLVAHLFEISEDWNLIHDNEAIGSLKHPLNYIILGGVPGMRQDSLVYRRSHQPYCAVKHQFNSGHSKDAVCLLDDYEVHSVLPPDHLVRHKWCN